MTSILLIPDFPQTCTKLSKISDQLLKKQLASSDITSRDQTTNFVGFDRKFQTLDEDQPQWFFWSDGPEIATSSMSYSFLFIISDPMFLNIISKGLIICLNSSIFQEEYLLSNCSRRCFSDNLGLFRFFIGFFPYFWVLSFEMSHIVFRLSPSKQCWWL